MAEDSSVALVALARGAAGAGARCVGSPAPRTGDRSRAGPPRRRRRGMARPARRRRLGRRSTARLGPVDAERSVPRAGAGAGRAGARRPRRAPVTSPSPRPTPAPAPAGRAPAHRCRPPGAGPRAGADRPPAVADPAGPEGRPGPARRAPALTPRATGPAGDAPESCCRRVRPGRPGLPGRLPARPGVHDQGQCGLQAVPRAVEPVLQAHARRVLVPHRRRRPGGRLHRVDAAPSASPARPSTRIPGWRGQRWRTAVARGPRGPRCTAVRGPRLAAIMTLAGGSDRASASAGPRAG